MSTKLLPGARVRVEDAIGYAYPDPIWPERYMLITLTDTGLRVEQDYRREQLVEAPLSVETLTREEIAAARQLWPEFISAETAGIACGLRPAYADEPRPEDITRARESIVAILGRQQTVVGAVIGGAAIDDETGPMKRPPPEAL